MPNTWQEYEQEILDSFQKGFPGTQISLNQTRLGRYSKIKRQIDILIEGKIAGHLFSLVVDAKFYQKKVDVKGVEEFIGMLNDIGAHKGLLITQTGYSEAAMVRAFNDPLDIELDILSFEELANNQAFTAIPIASPYAVALQAPFGCVIDAYQYGQAGLGPYAHIYQRGFDYKKAWAHGEIMYVQFWDRQRNNETLDDLLQLQERNIRAADPNAIIEYTKTITRNDARTELRYAKIATNKELLEYTGFIDFKEFILFVVLMTPEATAAKNVRKLETVLASATPYSVKIKDDATGLLPVPKTHG